MNRTKTVVYTEKRFKEQEEELKQEIKVQVKLGLDFPLLGTYIGDETLTKLWLKEKLGEFESFMDTLLLLKDKQTQWAILRHTYTMPKYINILSTIPKKISDGFYYRN